MANCEEEFQGLNSITQEELKKKHIIQLGSLSHFGSLRDSAPIYLFRNNTGKGIGLFKSAYERGTLCEKYEYDLDNTLNENNTDNTNRYPDMIYLKNGPSIDRKQLTFPEISRKDSNLKQYSMYTITEYYTVTGGRKKRNTKKKVGKKSKKSKTSRKK